MSELLPCPFCGADAAELHENPHADMAWVACIVCGLEAPSETGVQAEQAIDYWNSRPDASSQAKIERLKAAATSAIALLTNSSAELDQADPKQFHGQIAEALFLLRAALSGSKE